MVDYKQLKTIGINMRTVQQIFKAVIKNGNYQHCFGKLEAPYMCTAMVYAEWENIITLEERLKAEKAIDKYLRHLNYYRGTRFIALDAALEENKIPAAFEDRKQIYLNWSKRPMVPA